jgi:photosystem II stability/assembly factor-like uncharacterized protein
LGDVVINTILVDPRDGNRVIIGSDDAGVLQSVDHGKTFTPINQGFTQRQISALKVDPRSNKRLYAAVAMDRHFGGFFYSTDGGKNWAVFNEGLGKAVSGIHTILPLAVPQEIILGTNSGLFRGEPGKREWTMVEGTKGMAVIGLCVDSKQQLLFLASRGRILRLALNSAKLTELPLPAADFEISALLFDGVHSGLFVASNRGIYRSDNRGDSWREKGKGLPAEPLRALELADSRLLCSTTRGVYFSDDQGNSWYQGRGDFPFQIISISSNPVHPEQIVATDMMSGYFFISEDRGASWDTVDLGAALSKVSGFSYAPAGELFAGTVTEGVVRVDWKPESSQLVQRSR